MTLRLRKAMIHRCCHADHGRCEIETLAAVVRLASVYVALSLERSSWSNCSAAKDDNPDPVAHS
ncbi:hypothetical protein, partial [Streptomyces tateyamensis]|uniref:hypothetical protein n=1 Tax=Streptomyces tateyamensis TaxID=565073 RepID=UPI001C64C7EC